ncbi:putative neprosin [Medicago truncatula]|uniref:Putative neprosin n=1 Tax=Medicago truncatula TaxID=3880 RepID=A0A396ID29_MEDTR|nr:uncharacterized protein LOC25493742 [Medicago truncatula]RHN63486.1 putative neprosin [Medicago truncatula]
MDMKGYYSVSWTNKYMKDSFFSFQLTRRQHQCKQENHVVSEQTTTSLNHSLKLSSSTSLNTLSPILHLFVTLLLFFTSISPILSHPIVSNSTSSQVQSHSKANQTFRPDVALHKLKRIRAHLKKINKLPVKTIKSPDGDLIDCIISHQQPAFDHPLLKGQKPLDPPERPKGYNKNGENATNNFQLWIDSGEECPKGTVPIRRTTEQDFLRASSIRRFGRKPRGVRRDSTGNGHEHAVVFVNGEQYYGAKASINVWTPRVTDQYEFSLSQIWVIAGSFGNDLNTLEAGWQVSPELYGDNYPRFFTYWTTDAYQATGCYNLLCSGFIQTNNRIAIGAAISPRSFYSGRQFDIGLMIWKDPKHGHWWLEFGSGLLVGYWPANLFSHLRSHASMVQFGGEIVNSRSRGYHTGTQMGSGHFSGEGFRKAAYFRNLQVVDWDNNLLPLSNIHQLADHSNCYDVKEGRNNVWGTYFYYGGPGRNVRCP